MSKTKSERLNDLYKKYNLTTEDIWKNPSQGWTIITRSGIDKIQASAEIDIVYEVISHDLENVIIKGTGRMGDKKIETFGESSPKNTRNSYPIAIAEKRAMSRVVLKLSGFYELGVFGEDESDDFKKPSKDKQIITSRAISKANDMVLRGEKTAEEMIEILEENYEVGESIKFNLKQLKAQKA